MTFRSNWYEDTTREINLHKDTLSQKGQKKYKLDLLLRVAKRVADFSTECGECQMFQQEITTLTKELGYSLQLLNKETRKRHSRTIGNITKHLQKQHKLVSKGQYIGIGMAIGVVTGTALGAALDNASIGPAIGTAIGLAIGAYLDNKAKKEGRVI